MVQHASSTPSSGTSQAPIRFANLRRLLNPESIAVIGASANPDKLGYAVVKNILDGGYRGKVYPVNPTAPSILGLECFRDAVHLPADVDLAIIILPAQKVPDVLRTVAARGVKGAVIPAGGFAESGGAGIDLERQIREICATYPIRILGPNVPGFINWAARLGATIAGGPVVNGELAIISQAGSVAYLLTRHFLAEQIRFGQFICVGNQLDVSEADVIEYLADDPTVRAICLYVESVKDGPRFLSIARTVSRRTPIVAVKGGRSAAGASAILSHTASISSPEQIYRAALRKGGVVLVDSLRTLGATAFALAYQRPNAGERIAIVTSLAGVGVLAADYCVQHGLRVPEPSEPVRTQLAKVVPPAGSLRNPFDVTGDVNPRMLAEIIGILADSVDYDGILLLVMGVPGSVDFGNAAYAAALKPALEAAIVKRKAIAVSWVMDEAGGQELSEVRRLLNPSGVPIVAMPEDAVAVMRGLVDYARDQASIHNAQGGPASPEESVHADLELPADATSVLTEHACKALLEKLGLPVAKSRLAQSESEALALADHIGYPVVLKIQSPTLTHKSDHRGVALNLRNREEVMSAYRDMMARLGSRDGPLDGISVQPMIAAKGVELICGVATDPQFGKYLMLGLGGVTTEVYGDVCQRMLPVSPADVGEMLNELKGAALLGGFRGGTGVDRKALIDFILRFCQLAGAKAFLEIEINPLLATPEGVFALDARAQVAIR